MGRCSFAAKSALGAAIAAATCWAASAQSQRDVPIISQSHPDSAHHESASPGWLIRQSRAIGDSVFTISNFHPTDDIVFMDMRARSFVVRHGSAVDFPCVYAGEVVDLRTIDGASILRVKIDCGQALKLTAGTR